MRKSARVSNFDPQHRAPDPLGFFELTGRSRKVTNLPEHRVAPPVATVPFRLCRIASSAGSVLFLKAESTLQTGRAYAGRQPSIRTATIMRMVSLPICSQLATQSGA
jgi:hypothetical protein